MYTDAMINSSSWFNNTELGSTQNVYWDGNNGSRFHEPLNYTRWGNFAIYPYSSYSVMNQQSQPDGRYTTFDATILSNWWGSAWAVYDWGNDEEAAGNGIPSIPEMKVYVEDTTVAADQINVSISADNVHFYNVNSSLYVKADPSGDFYTVEVDPTMGDADINFYRYFRFEVLSGKLKVDVFETTAWNNPIYDALSVETGSMTFKNENTPTPVGYVGTIDGAILAVTWDETERGYVIKWDSWNDERWKLKTNIFDLEVIKQTGRFPGWIDRGAASDTLDLSGNLPDGGVVVSWTAENFYNSRNENFLEYVLISDFGNIFVYQQTSPYSTPIYNQKLTDMLFGRIGDPVTRTVGSDAGYGVKDWIQQFNSISPNGNKYFSISILPIDVTVVTENFVNDKFDPYSNGFMLYLGGWDGSLGNLDQGDAKSVLRGQVDVSIWYMITDTGVDPNESPDICDAYGLPVCTYFQPLRQTNNYNPYYDLNGDQYIATLSTQELTGQMWGTFSASTWMPKVAAADFIATTHNDYVVTNGKVTLMEAQFGFGAAQPTHPDFVWGNSLPKQAFILSQADPVLSEFNFVVKGGYFDEINANSKGRHWSNANPVDFDGDGDMDLILGFATYSDPYFGMDKVTFGATYWENQGSREEPKWVELPLAITNTDPDSGFRAQNYTDPLFIYDEYDMTKVSSSALGYHPSFRTGRPQRLLMWQPKDHQSIFTGSIHTFFAEYNHPSSLLAATYPEAKRIDINLRYVDNGGYDTNINYGFHVFETWDNSEELNDWTLSLSTADLDEDGRNEIIVGDFNNNIYVFEHLSNNTYKRAFKSFDINRTIETDLSPYAYEQFDGITGEFSRTLFDHIEFLIAGFDLNNNSRQEFIAATENMIFVFEATTSPTGRIIDDTYQLIKIIDLLDFPTLSNQRPGQTKISAMTWGDDLTQDGRRELIIAATSGLLVLEVDKAPTPGYKEMGQFTVEEIFFADSYNLLGLYDLPGNYFIHPELVIETLLVEDLDSDGFLDLAVGGTNTFGARPLYSGFLTIMEWKGSSFRLLEEEGAFDDMVQYNPVHDLAVDDADFDGYKELLVAHDYGIDVYEFRADDTIELMEVITSSPHYRFPDRYYNKVTPLTTHIHKDVIRSPDGLSLIMVMSDASGLWYTTSTDEGKTWATEQALRIAGGPQIQGLQPSLAINTLTGTDEVWLSFVVRSGIDPVTYQMWVIRNVQPGVNSPVLVDSDTVSSGNLDDNTPSPRLFNIAGNNDANVMGLVHIVHPNNAMKFVKVNLGGPIIQDTYFADWANSSILPNKFAVHSLDITQLDGDTRKYGVVFSGYPFGESKSLDLDLFYDEIYLNNTNSWLFNVTTPNRIYASGMAARNPSIIQEHHTGNLLITYEEQTLRPYGGLWGVWSNDRGYSWNGPHDMSHPLGLDMPLLIEALPTKSRESYVITATIGFEAITDFESRIPVVVPGNNRGFTMVYNVRVEFQIDIRDLSGGSADQKGSRVGICAQPSDGSALSNHASQYESDIGCKRGINVNMIVSAINPWSNFTWYELGSVSEIVVGDTDRDSRHEILAASGKQAFLFEFAHNSDTFILHQQKWKSDPYDRDITGIAISDANGNGYPEIVLESDRGIVQTFEVVDVLKETSNLMYSVQETILRTPETAGFDNSVVAIEAVDLNSDGIEDLVYSTLGGYIIAIDGSDYSTLWSQTYAGVTNSLFWHSVERDVQMKVGYNSDGNSSFVALSREHILDIYDATVGTQQTRNFGFSSPETRISFLTTADVIDGGDDEVLVGLYNGSVFLLDSSDLSTIWNYDFSLGMTAGSYENDILDIQTAQFTNANVTEVAVLNNDGDVVLLAGPIDDVLWQTHESTISQYVGMALLDSDGDGKLDIIIGNNATMAISGLDGAQLWNTTNPVWDMSGVTTVDSAPIIYDVNEDGTDDVIYTTFHEPGKPAIYAISGDNGELIWTYTPKVDAIVMANGNVEIRMIEMQNGQDVLFVQNLNAVQTNPGLTLMLNPKSGVAVGGISNELSGIATEVSNLGSTRPLVIVGDSLGNVTIHSLWAGQPIITAAPPPDFKEQPFFRLGSEFTRRTEYLVYDSFKSTLLPLDGDGLGDGVDDVFVLDDDYIGAGDTHSLLNIISFNNVEWSIQPSTLPLGRYLGGAQLGDVNGDGIDDIVAPFQNYFVAVNVTNGNILWVTKHHYEFDDFNVPRDFHFQLAELDNSIDGLEVVYTRFLWFMGWPITEIAILNGDDGTKLPNLFIPFGKDVVFNVADLDGVGVKSIVSVNYFFNPTISILAVFNQNLGLKDSKPPVVINGMFPITEIAVANFDQNDNGDEFIYFFEMAELDLPDIIYNLIGFPTLFMQFDWDGASTYGYVLPPGLANIIGIAPTGEPTANYWIDSRGATPSMIVESTNGDIFSYNFNAAGGLLMQEKGIIRDKAIPYAKTTFVTTDLCGGGGFIALGSANTLECYSTMDFSNLVVETSLTLEFSVIQDMV
ncbi:MAG: hypothetical protein ACW98K_07590, partial [Candidatus Kariarchaeaceae archaeon]